MYAKWFLQFTVLLAREQGACFLHTDQKKKKKSNSKHNHYLMHGKMCGADNFSPPLQRWEQRKKRVNKRLRKATALVKILQPPVFLKFPKETPLFTGNANSASPTKAHFLKQCAISAGWEPCLPTMQYKRIQATASTGRLSSTARKETAVCG